MRHLRPTLCLVGVLLAAPAAAQRQGNSTVDGLLSKGYSASVARRIVAHSPQVARAIVEDAEGGQRLLLYRGIRVPPNRFVPTGGRGSSKQSSIGRTWFSTSLFTAARYGSRGKHRIRTILEVEMPLHFWQPWKIRTPGAEGTVLKTDVRDLSPYIKRVGLLEAGNWMRNLNSIPWFSYEKAQELKLFSPSADYQKIIRDFNEAR